MLALIAAGNSTASLISIQTLTHGTRTVAGNRSVDPALTGSVDSSFEKNGLKPVVLIDLNVNGGYYGNLYSGRVTAGEPLAGALPMQVRVAPPEPGTMAAAVAQDGTKGIMSRIAKAGPIAHASRVITIGSSISVYAVAVEPIALALAVLVAMLLTLAGLNRFWGNMSTLGEMK